MAQKRYVNETSAKDDAINNLLDHHSNHSDPDQKNTLTQRIKKWPEDVSNELASENNESLTGQKVSEKIAEIFKNKWGKLPYDKLKEKAQQDLLPQNCQKLNIPLTNKDVWLQLNNYQRRNDLRLSNLQQNIQKAAVANLKTIENLLHNNKCVDVKNLLKSNLDAISLLGHTCSELSSIRRVQIKPALNSEFSSLCDKEYDDSEILFGSDITKNLNKAKELIGG